MTRSPRTPKILLNLSESISRQLNMYALAAGAAGVGILALAQPVEGRIVYTPTHKHIGPHQRLPIDLNHNKTADFRLKDTGTCGTDLCNTWLAVTQAANGNGIVGPKSSLGIQWASALKKGTRVGPGRNFYAQGDLVFMDDGSVWPTSPWAHVGTRYLGLKFQIHGQTHYGWARLFVKITAPPFPKISGMLTGYAYETIPNKPIIAGQTAGPDLITIEPGTLGELALGRK